MAALGHHGVVRTKKIRTTVPGKDGHRAGDLLNRDFTAPAPNLVTSRATDGTRQRSAHLGPSRSHNAPEHGVSM